MKVSNLYLGCTLRRDVFETIGGARLALPCADKDSLIVFRHDLKAFAIPTEHVACLSELYQQYLMASGILVCSDETAESCGDEEESNYDRTTLCLIHEDLKVPFKENAFNLDAAINFIEQESDLSRTLAIRWCMMMEYITHEDQRDDALRKGKQSNEIEKQLETKSLILGGVDDG